MKFKNFRKFDKKIIEMFGSTYVCGQLFFFRKLTKNLSKNKADWSEMTSVDQSQNCKHFSKTDLNLQTIFGIKPQDIIE